MADLPWIVELVHPPGIFLARQLTEPKTFEELESERFESVLQLPLYRRQLPPELDTPADRLDRAAAASRSRWLLLHVQSGILARGICEELAKAIPDPSPPWTNDDIEKVTQIFRVFVEAFDERKKAKDTGKSK